MREPAYYEFRVPKSRTFDKTLTWKDSAGQPINLTGYTAKLQARKDAKSATVVFAMTVTLGGTAGTIRLQMTSTETADLAEGSYEYDLEVVSGGGIADSLLFGPIIVEEVSSR